MMLRILAVIAALGCAEAARAQIPAAWSTVASSCVPDETTSKFDRHNFDLGSVRHAGSNVGLIVLNCPMAPFNHGGSTSWNLIMEYQDSTGEGTNAFVRAKLSMRPYGGNPAVIVSVNSNSKDVSGVTFLRRAFNYQFDFGMAAYWVQIELDRSSASETVLLNSVRLIDISPD